MSSVLKKQTRLPAVLLLNGGSVLAATTVAGNIYINRKNKHD
jgi:hypothetical protein